jgi:hypothetical protein
MSGLMFIRITKHSSPSPRPSRSLHSKKKNADLSTQNSLHSENASYTSPKALPHASPTPPLLIPLVPRRARKALLHSHSVILAPFIAQPLHPLQHRYHVRCLCMARAVIHLRLAELDIVVGQKVYCDAKHGRCRCCEVYFPSYQGHVRSEDMMSSILTVSETSL